MSGTLCARIKSPQNYTWSFKAPIREAIKNKFPSGFISTNGISYISGLRDASSDKHDIEALSDMIATLAEGHDIEFVVEY